jgi:hypothetical protein
MSKKDWNEVWELLEAKAPNLMNRYISSNNVFLPNRQEINPYNPEASNFSASDLKKGKPGQWIPVYYQKDVPENFRRNNIVPIRAGSAEFFFYKGVVFFDLERVSFEKIDTTSIQPIENYVPSTLKAKFQRNENAYLNKAVALGYINHFVDNDNLSVFKKQIKTKEHKRLLYGQFGKIKTTNPLNFRTSKGDKTINPGFQFEIDLVLENENEIIIFEAKTGSKPFQNFSLLQLYYPLIYLYSILEDPKPIRTIFMDITTLHDNEIYRMVEIVFKENLFDEVEVLSAHIYEYSGD